AVAKGDSVCCRGRKVIRLRALVHDALRRDRSRLLALVHDALRRERSPLRALVHDALRRDRSRLRGVNGEPLRRDRALILASAAGLLLWMLAAVVVPADAQAPNAPDSRFAGLQWTFVRIKYDAFTMPRTRFTVPEDE